MHVHHHSHRQHHCRKHFYRSPRHCHRRSTFHPRCHHYGRPHRRSYSRSKPPRAVPRRDPGQICIDHAGELFGDRSCALSWPMGQRRGGRSVWESDRRRGSGEGGGVWRRGTDREGRVGCQWAGFGRSGRAKVRLSSFSSFAVDLLICLPSAFQTMHDSLIRLSAPVTSATAPGQSGFWDFIWRALRFFRFS